MAGGVISFAPAGSFMVAGPHAPAALQGRLYLVFFSADDAGIMAWDIATPDQDILFPVLVRKYGMESLARDLPAACRELLNGGPATLEAGRERDFFILHDKRPKTDMTNEIDDQFSYSVLTSSARRMQELEDMQLGRFLVIRGFAGFDAGPLRDQIASGWWRFMPADADVVFHVAAEMRHGRAVPSGAVQ